MLDDLSRKQDFPALRTRTYLNTAAEGLPPPAVEQALVQYFQDKSLGMSGRERHFATWEAAKRLVGQFFGLSSNEVSICSCTSEAFNLAALALNLQAGDEVVINDLDFPAGVTPWLQPRCPATVKLWRARDGALRVEDLAPLLGPSTRLVSSSLVSYFNGFKIPLEAVVESVHRHSSALLALDVTQALGRVPLDLRGVDLIVSSTHKWILASHGGGLVGVPSARAHTWTVPAGGWFNLDDAFGSRRFQRAASLAGAASFTTGMPNFPAVYAIRAGLEYIAGIGVAAIDRAARPLVHACLEGLVRLPVELLTPREDDALAGIVAFRHPRAAAIHERLGARNIDLMHHAGRLRVAVHGYNTREDIDTFLRELRPHSIMLEPDPLESQEKFTDGIPPAIKFVAQLSGNSCRKSVAGETLAKKLRAGNA